jgi:AcrR family transcriptional regulator
MATKDTQAATGPNDAPTPLFRRAKPADALDLAVATFLGEARLDMQSLAARLAVSPATLYRWFGSRAMLLDKVCERLADEFAADARATARGNGDERVCDYARRVMVSAAASAPVRSFVGREPQLALRLLLGKDGSVHRVLVQRTAGIIDETRPPGQPRPPDEHVHLLVQVTTALVWATFVIGDEPQIEDGVEIVRMILASGRSPR